MAELNCCSTDDIREILGLEVKPKKNPKGIQKITLNTEEINSLYARLDELDAQIRPLEDEYRRTAEKLMMAEENR